MKRDDKFLDPIAEEDKSQVFTELANERVSSNDSGRRDDVLESPEYAEAYKKLLDRIIPAIDIRDPSGWAVYGSAEKYYESAYEYIHNSYPYDGSALEKVNWTLSASVVDLAVLQHEYPLAVGHVGFSTSSWGSLNGSKSGLYGLSKTPEYIKFSGGPYVGSVFDSATKRDSSLKIDPSSGNTVEFWLRKNSFIDNSLTESEIIFDSHTSNFDEGNEKYGRFLLELQDASGSPLYVTYMSGTVGADRQQIGQNLTASDVADGKFHHYAIATHHTGSSLNIELYIDGVFNHRVTISTATFGPVTDYFNASIGALRTTKNSNGGLGYGKLSGSIDEFRFWKIKRTAEQIGNYYDVSVYGATDKELINSDLSVYYKFNEGIAGSEARDKVILDYSGRVNNGEFVGYTAAARSEKSAIDIADVTELTEVGDPIIDPKSSRVISTLENLRKLGQEYDKFNHASLFKSVPNWAFDVSSGASNLNSDFSILLQGIAQRFDSIRMLIADLPKVGITQFNDFVNSSGSVDYSQNFYNILGCTGNWDLTYKRYHSENKYSVQNLLAKGFDVGELPIINQATLDEYFNNLRFNKKDYVTNLPNVLIDSKVEAVKDKILNSIHANLMAIYKRKGTKESFRNLIRCFGVDEDLLAFNVYGQNVEKVIKDTPVYESLSIKSFAFTGSNINTTIQQTANGSNPDERHYIQGKSAPSSMTLEANVLFPKILERGKTAVTTSVFGMYAVSSSSNVITSDNYAGLVVKTVKNNVLQTGCKFELSSTAGLWSTITTDYFSEVYSNTPWYLAVRFSEDTSTPLLNSDNRGTQTYKVDFIGYRYDQDVRTSMFEETATITQANYQNFISANKGVFIGANRATIGGSVTNQSDCKILSFSVWDDALEISEMQEHAKSVENLGRLRPLQQPNDNQGAYTTKADKLIINWLFDSVSNLNTNTTYVFDRASGSLDNIAKFGNIIGHKYPGITVGLQHQEGSIQQEFIPSVKYLPIDNLESESRIEIKDREIDSFEINSRPVSYLYSFEKSMYQVISKEMLNMLAGATAFNNLIGEPVYKYRQEYKSLEKLRERFFSKVENTIDLEGFIEYYKWIDSSLSLMLKQIQPATTDMNLNLEDVVESHAFERNKYKHQAPQFEYKDPKLVGQILGVNELLYDWEHGHAPLSNNEADNCLWWSDRANRITNKFVTSSSDSANRDREDLRQRRNTVVSGSTYVLRKLSRPYDLSAQRLRTFEIGSNRNANKNKDLHRVIVATDKQIQVNKSDINEFKQCRDVLNPQEEKLYTAKTNTTGTDGYLDADADMILPFSLYSSSAGNDFSIFKENLKITNNHDDQRSVLQSTHMRSLVGGMPHRRVKFGTSDANRPEAYLLSASADVLTLKAHPSSPKSYTARGLGIQSPYNLTNVKQDITNKGAATATIKVVTVGDISNGNTFTLVDPSGKITIYTFNNGVARNSSGGSGGSATVGISDLPGSQQTRHMANAIALAINNTTDTNYSAVSDNVSTVVITQGQKGTRGNRKNTTSMSSITLSNFSGGFHLIELGNYVYDYDIVQTSGRSVNNSYITENGLAFKTSGSLGYIAGLPDFTSPVRGRTEHVFVSKFSSPGGPETQAVYGRDKETGEYSVYNTLNYRNLSVRTPLNKLSKEHSGQFGHREDQSALLQGATATITSTAPASIDSTITLISTDGTTITYTAKSGTNTSNNEFRTHTTNTESRIINMLDNLKLCIEDSNGHNGKILATRTGTTLTLTQAVAGLGGQTTISHTLDGAVVSSKFDFFSIASLHMTNRNHFYTTKSAGQITKRDNQFVQHAIPQNDFSYSWIAASAVNSKFDFVRANDGFGHQHLFSSGSEKAIQFVSASLVGSAEWGITATPRTVAGDIYGRLFGIDRNNLNENALEAGSGVRDFWNFTPVDIANLNTIVQEPINIETNTVGHESVTFTGDNSLIKDLNYINQSYVFGSARFDGTSPETRADGEGASVIYEPMDGIGALLNSIILNRQGPYGWPSWKQIRGGEHPIIRAHRKTNTFTRVFLGDPTVGVSSIIKSRNTPSMNLAAETHRDASQDAYQRARSLDERNTSTKSRIIKTYTEVPVTEKFNPVRMIMHGVDSPNGTPQDYASTLDFRLPQYFLSKNEGIPNLVQSDRESNWNFNRRYYQKFDIPQRRIVFKNETMQNDLTTFANQQIIIDSEFKEKTIFKFDLYRFLSSADTLGTLVELNYAETIYPREVNTFTDKIRNRSSFDYFPWKSSREIRNIALTGNITHDIFDSLLYVSEGTGFYAFSKFESNNVKDSKKSIFGQFDILRLGRNSTSSDLRTIPYHITMSSWPLDARKDFSSFPVDMNKSFLAEGNKMFTGSVGRQGTFGEGILQNDFSTFPLGMNNMYGTPPISMVYNRRIPQIISGSNKVYLTGEAKWEAGDNNKGPFYDSYSDYSQDIKSVAPDHTIVPEFRMSEFVEDTINRTRDYPNIGDDFLILTGAIYQNSSGDIDVGGTFFKTYSNSDFLKYFSSYEENLLGDVSDPEQNLSHGRINFKCKAAMKFLPYKGFYPAERTVELAKLFHDNYISDNTLNSANISPPAGSPLTVEQATRYAKLRANASRYQATKPLFGPGLLFNSIKSGLAVDYPIFSGSFSNVYANLPDTTLMTNMGDLDMPAGSFFTGSLINGSTGSAQFGIPRLTSSNNNVKRIEFEDLLSPTNIFGEAMYDNEPHPSASLIYGNQHFHKIIERPGFFGKFDEEDAQKRLGLNFTNTRRAFSRQISPYTLASQNFAAESVNFFLEDGHLTTAVSKPIRERFEAGTYKMRVHLNNVDTVMYDRPSAFGPPVDDGAGGVSLNKYTQVVSNATTANFKLTFNDISGSGGTPKYSLNNITASHHFPQLIFQDERDTDNNFNLYNIFLYNEDFYTPPGTPDVTSGNVKIYTKTNSDVPTILQRVSCTRSMESIALINVKNSLGTAIATDIKTALDNPSVGMNIITNRVGNVLAITSSVSGPREGFNYYESSASEDLFRGSEGCVEGTRFLFTDSGLPNTGSFKDAVDGIVTLHGNVYSETHSNPAIDIITDGTSGQPTSFTVSSTTSKTEHGFAPFTPPFLDPNSSPYVEISFTVSEAGVFGAQEIIEKSTFEYYNFHTAPSNAASNTNYRHSMALSASLNLGMCVTLRTDNLEQIEGHGLDGNAGGINLREVDPNNLLQRWVIQTKWETPIMDFSQVVASAYDLSDNSITQVSGSPWKTRYWDSYYDRGLPRANVTSGHFLTGSTGMWHQKGSTLNERDAKGYFLSIKDIPQANGAGGLAEKLGFNISEERSAGALKRAKEYRSRIGLVEDRKIVKEAIVAIPYVLREDLGNKIEFVRLNKDYHEIARQNVTAVRNQMKTIPLTDRILTIEDYNSFRAETDGKIKTPLSDAPIDAIEYQLFMMDEYILPPQFDFTRVPRNAAAADIPDPFMIYFFQFHASFNREDLSNIWQNLYPKSPGSTASARYSYTNEKLLGRLRAHNDVSYVSHYLDTVDLNGVPLCPADDPRALFSPEGDNKTRWLVFKVKQRGMNSLEQVRRKSIDPRLQNIESLQYLAEAKSSENALTLPKNIPGRREDGTMDLQFNWPYDYFSFVELIKLEAKIDSFNYKK